MPDIQNTNATQCGVGVDSVRHQLYQNVEALLYGMNATKVDIKAAARLASQHPDDPVMLAVQALLQVKPVVSVALWKKSKDLGLLSSAKRSHGFAQAMAGCMTEFTVEGVHYLAEAWYEQGAEKGNATAQYFLGKSFEESQDVESARRWYQTAALSGHSSAQASLGKLLSKGVVQHHGEISAQSWLESSAKQGDMDGQVNLAFLFSGSGDHSAADLWYNTAKATSNKLREFLVTNEDNDDLKNFFKDKAQDKLKLLFVQDESSNSIAVDNKSICMRQLGTADDGNKSSKYSKMRLSSLSWMTGHDNAKLPYNSKYSLTQGSSLNMSLSSSMSFQLRSGGSKQALTLSSVDSLKYAAMALPQDDLPIDLMELDDEDDLVFPGFNHQDPSDAFPCEIVHVCNEATTANFMEQESNASQIMADDSMIDARQQTIRNVEPDVIQPYHAVLADRSGRRARLTAGTKELRATKDWYRENKLAYQRRGCQAQLFKDAMALYYQKMSAHFNGFPTDTAARENSFLIHCSKPVLQSGRVQEPNCFRHAQDKEHQYGTAKFPEAVLFYFNSKDPPKLEGVVTKYRGMLDNIACENSPSFDYFSSYLQFCEMTLQQASAGCPNAQLAIEKNNFIPTLKALWRDLAES